MVADIFYATAVAVNYLDVMHKIRYVTRNLLMTLIMDSRIRILRIQIDRSSRLLS